jgi:WD40 repeat protein
MFLAIAVLFMFFPQACTGGQETKSQDVKSSKIKDDREIRTLSGHSGSIYSLSFSADGSKLASGSSDKTIKIWSVSDGSETRTLRGHSGSVYSVGLSPDGTKLASGSGDNTIKIWSVEGL